MSIIVYYMNCQSSLNLISIIQYKIPILIQAIETKYSRWQLDCNKMFPMFSPWFLGQIGLPMTVLESAHHEDCKTVPDLWIWWRIDWVIQGWRQSSISKESIKVKEKLIFEMLSIVFNLKYLSQNFIKFKDQGQFGNNPHDDSKTVIGSPIWPKNHGENIGNILLQTNCHLL